MEEEDRADGGGGVQPLFLPLPEDGINDDELAAFLSDVGFSMLTLRCGLVRVCSCCGCCCRCWAEFPPPGERLRRPAGFHTPRGDALAAPSPLRW